MPSFVEDSRKKEVESYVQMFFFVIPYRSMGNERDT